MVVDFRNILSGTPRTFFSMTNQHSRKHYDLSSLYIYQEQNDEDDDDDDDDLLVSQSRYRKFNQLLKWCENIWSFKWKNIAFPCSLQFFHSHSIRFDLVLPIRDNSPSYLIYSTHFFPMERYFFTFQGYMKSHRYSFVINSKIKYHIKRSSLTLVLLKHHYNIHTTLIVIFCRYSQMDGMYIWRYCGK